MTSARTPPRFVPTLTTVVDLAVEETVPAAGAQTLDELVPVGTPAATAAALPGAPADPHATALRLSDEDAFRLEEDLMHRVLQRVDLSLEERLTDAVSTAVQQQLDAMLPKLRTSIETVLRQLVLEALAQELSENPGRTPRG